ncbi:MAG TPA: hypothetical protein VN829_13925 [Dongiaceae bacterium]|nr:hypothetical protein [Dongiaceae bacterium]
MSPFGIYSDRPTVSDAIDVLRGAGYRIVNTAVLLRENEGKKGLGHETTGGAPAGAAMGAVVGAAIGATLAWLSATGRFPVGDWRPFADTGRTMAAFAGAGAGGAMGWLIGLFAGARRRRRGEQV